MPAADSNRRARRPWCSGEAVAADPPREPRRWPPSTEESLVDFAERLSHELLPYLSALAWEYDLIATTTDLVDATGAVSAKLVLAEPRAGRPEDTLGLIVLPPGAQPGDAILFTRRRG